MASSIYRTTATCFGNPLAHDQDVRPDQVQQAMDHLHHLQNGQAKFMPSMTSASRPGWMDNDVSIS